MTDYDVKRPNISVTPARLDARPKQKLLPTYVVYGMLRVVKLAPCLLFWRPVIQARHDKNVLVMNPELETVRT